MKRLLVITGLSLLLGACSIDMVQMKPEIEEVVIDNTATLQGVTCSIEGVVPHITNLQSSQVALNINAEIDAFVHEAQRHIAGCPKSLLDLVVDGAEITDSTTVSYKVGVLNEYLFSVVLTTSQYFEGAAHPNNSLEVFTFSLQDGQPVAIVELLPTVADIDALITRRIQEELVAQGIDAEYPSETSNKSVKFYVTPDAIMLTDIFSTHALQGFEVPIPFTLPST